MKWWHLGKGRLDGYLAEELSRYRDMPGWNFLGLSAA